MPSQCMAKNCTAEATHILLTHRYDWNREAIQADEAPPVQVSPTITATPVAYLCAKHAKEKSRGKQ